MRRFIGVSLLIISVGLTICVLWILQLKHHSNSEVVKIYKTTPYIPRAARSVKSSPSTPSIDPSTNSTTENAEAFEANDDEHTQSTEDNFFSEDEDAFSGMLFTDGNVSETTGAEETADTGTEDEFPELTGGEIASMVLAAYDLHDILDEYGVTVSPYDNQGTCPFCSTPETFEVIYNGSTGNGDYWGCAASYCIDNGVLKPNDLIDFVGRIQGMERYEAARYLAERKGILE